MAKNDPTEPEKVSLEDLLRLKRHEHPDDAQWERFDRELRAKSWQGLVAPSSRRKSWSQRIWDAGRLGFPLGAAATLALTLYVGVSPFQTASITPAPVTASLVPVPVAELTPAESSPAAAETMTLEGDPHFVVGSFSADEASGATFTRVPSTHYMPATQNDRVHYSYNAIDRTSHQTLAMATEPVRSFY